MQMADLRRDFQYNLRLLEGRDEALAAAEAAAEAAAREASTLRGDAARLTTALQEAKQGALGVSRQVSQSMRVYQRGPAHAVIPRPLPRC